jgi:hypothetical protein
MVTRMRVGLPSRLLAAFLTYSVPTFGSSSGSCSWNRTVPGVSFSRVS